MAVDQPTPADLGNLTEAQFLALLDWSINPVNNDPSADDTFAAARQCIVPLLYRIYRENFRWINEAFACRVDTPLSLKAAMGGGGGAPFTPASWADTDNGSVPLTAAFMSSLAIQPPTMLFTCNGTADDEYSAQSLIEVDSGTSDEIIFAVASSRGSEGLSGGVFYGARPTLEHWYANGTYDSSVSTTRNVLFSAKACPEWGQSNDGIVIACVTDITAPTSPNGFADGSTQWVFSLESADLGGSGQDWSLVLTYGNLPNRAVCRLGDYTGNPISITSGRDYTLGFAVVDLGGGNSVVRFFVNGLQVGVDQTSAFSFWTARDDGAMRLQVGAFRQGDRYCGGHVSNVYYWNGNDGATDDVGIQNQIYQAGAGYSSV